MKKKKPTCPELERGGYLMIDHKHVIKFRKEAFITQYPNSKILILHGNSAIHTAINTYLYFLPFPLAAADLFF